MVLFVTHGKLAEHMVHMSTWFVVAGACVLDEDTEIIDIPTAVAGAACCGGALHQLLENALAV